MLSISSNKTLFLWVLANIFFAFQFILRLSVGILREEIIQNFTVDSASFGTLAGCYYLGYACAQIPFGILLDSFSFRLVTSCAVAIATIGTIIFITTNTWNVLLFGRFLIGVGSGSAFLAVTKITKSCFHIKYHSQMLGFSFSFGLLGAVFGATPMQYMFDQFGYNKVFYILISIGIIIASTMLLFGKINEKIHDTAKTNTLHSIIRLMLNPQIILIGISGGLMVGSLEGFADVWAIPFFNQSMGFNKADSTTITSFVYVGMCFGGPVLTTIARIIRSPNLTIFYTGIATILIFIVLFCIPKDNCNLAIYIILMFCLGILCCYQVLVFIITADSVEEHSTSLAIAIINCINMSFGYIFHTVIALALTMNWNGEYKNDGSLLYLHDNFVFALSIIPICTFLGQFGFILLNVIPRSKP